MEVAFEDGLRFAGWAGQRRDADVVTSGQPDSKQTWKVGMALRSICVFCGGLPLDTGNVIQVLNFLYTRRETYLPAHRHEGAFAPTPYPTYLVEYRLASGRPCAASQAPLPVQ